MHELSIALSLLDLAEDESGRHGGRVAVVHLRLGPLSGVVRAALLAAYDLAREGTPMAEVELLIEDVPIAAYCPACDAEVECPSAHEIRCPACGTPTPEILRGRELEVVALEIAS